MSVSIQWACHSARGKLLSRRAQALGAHLDTAAAGARRSRRRDSRPLLVTNQLETRTYTAFYVLHDEEIGLVSDAVSVVCKP